MVMVFTLVSAAQEWLGNLSDELQNQKEEVERKKKDAEEEAERVINFFCDPMVLSNCLFRNGLKEQECQWSRL